MAQAPPWRLLAHSAADGAWNMAVDEAILEGYVAAIVPRTPTLRFYAWSPPALSLGRTQVAAGAHAPDFLEQHGIELVRRPTGGAAVLHDEELTYAVIGSLRAAPFSGGVHATYAAVAEALVAGLRALGLEARADAGPGAVRGGHTHPACFAALSAHEIAVGGRKLVGSAQLRRRGAFLQHGSIPLRADPARSAGAVGRHDERLAATDLERELGELPPVARLTAALVRAFERRFGATLTEGQLTPTERSRAAALRSAKYRSPGWTIERRPV